MDFELNLTVWSSMHNYLTILNQAKSKTKYQDVARTKLFQVAGQNMIEHLSSELMLSSAQSLGNHPNLHVVVRTLKKCMPKTRHMKFVPWFMPVYIVIILIYFVPHFWEPLLYIQLNSCAMFIHFNPWLVVWNIFYFSIYWECHHPNCYSIIFQRGRSTTKQIIRMSRIRWAERNWNPGQMEQGESRPLWVAMVERLIIYVYII